MTGPVTQRVSLERVEDDNLILIACNESLDEGRTDEARASG